MAFPGRHDEGHFTAEHHEQKRWLALVHVEVESRDRVAPLRPRMWAAYHHLRAKYDLPVLPIGLYLRVGLDGVGIDTYQERFWDLETVRFQYLYVGLPGLDALKYLEGDNWLGVALSALMRVPKERQVWLGAEALRRITGAPLNQQERYLLGECVESYLPLDEGQWEEFNRVLHTAPYQEANKMRASSRELGLMEGLEKGRQEGRQEERRELLRTLLEERFGPLSKRIARRVESLSAEEVSTLFTQALRAKSLRDLDLTG